MEIGSVSIDTAIASQALQKSESSKPAKKTDDQDQAEKVSENIKITASKESMLMGGKKDPKVGLDVEFVLSKNDPELTQHYLNRMLTIAEFDALKGKQIKQTPQESKNDNESSYAKEFRSERGKEEKEEQMHFTATA